MKNLSYTLMFAAIALTAVVSSCKKGSIKPITTNNSSLIGKWKLNAGYFGIGITPSWETVAPNDNHTVVFNADGSLGGNLYAQYFAYKATDSLVTFNNAADGELKLRYTIKHDTLTMTPAGPIVCIEGCAVRFIKQ